jgi:hypothetical protein
MTVTHSGPQRDLERQVGLCVKIGGLGFGPDVMRLALVREGVAPDTAKLIALSVARCRASLVAIEAGMEGGAPDRETVRPDHERYRASRASEYFLRRMAAFAWFGLIAVGGGVALGWAAGFDRGMAEGYDWVERSLDRLRWR